ncbi:MAG: HIT family protein [Candidatus Limnocylindrales bacterium]
MTDECIFCKIVAGDSPASVVHDDDQVMAFMDLFPVTPGHTLVVPKAHSVGIRDLDDQTGARMLAVARRVAQALTTSPLRCDGVNLFLADGEAAGQDVFHSHLHVIPRFEGDGFVVHGQRLEVEPTRAHLDEHAELIRGQLD